MNLLENISVLLFDLDNTLLFLDENKFVMSYASNLASYFKDVFQDPKIFIHHLLEGTKFMVKTNTSEKNIEKFFHYFVPQCKNLSKEIIYNRFLEFYNNEFDNVKYIVTPSPIVPKIFENVLQKGFEIVIATNPIFPEIATKKRLIWAGLGNYIDNLLLITHGEQFTTTKPNTQYYKQILDIIGRNASDCLMIGNDIYNDGSASLIGIKYFHLLPTNSNLEVDFLSKETQKLVNLSQINVTSSGTLEDLYKLL